MKIKNFIAVMLLATCAAPMSAEKTLLTPGKSWTVNERRVNGLRPISIKAKVEVCADTVIDNQPATMMKFHYLGRPDEAFYFPCGDDNGLIRDCLWGDLMDFSLTPGDPIHSDKESACKVLSENELEVNGRKFRELVISTADNQPIDSWVEGVGCFMGECVIGNSHIVGGNDRLRGYQIIDCSENGQVIFTQNDFSIKLRTYSDNIKPILEVGRWWNLEVTMPDSSTVDARAEIVVVENIDDKQFATVKFQIEGREPSEFTVYEYNHRLFVKDNIDYPIMDLGVVAQGRFGRFYRFNDDRSKLELTETEFGCGESISVGCMQNLIGRTDSDDMVTWAEGVGASRSMWITENGPQTILGYRMKECGQGDELLFTSRDFYYTPSSLNEVKVPTRAEGIYDLQGRKISRQHRGQIYISNGHVYRQ